jgi:hypothetical protein
MNARVRGVLEERGVIILLAMLLSLPLAIGAYASVHHSADKASASLGVSSAGSKHQRESGDTAPLYLPGGTSCYLPDGGSALNADWTHGDYVKVWSRWAAQQQQQGVSTRLTGTYVKAAARSHCGTPSSSVSDQDESGQSGDRSAEPPTQGDSHKP